MSVQVKTNDGYTFLVEVESKQAGQGERGVIDKNLGAAGGEAMGHAERVLDQTLFSKAVDVIRGVSQDVTNGLLTMNPRPSEVELSLNLGFDAGGNVWIFKGSASANLELVLRWKMP